MLRALITLLVVVIVKHVIARLLVVLGERRSKWSVAQVSCIATTTILFCIVFAITQFRREGLTVYSVFYLALMVWLAHGAARWGTLGMNIAERRH